MRWPHRTEKDAPSLTEMEALLVLWNADRGHKLVVHKTGSTVEFAHPGYVARRCACGTVFVVAKDVFEASCGEHTCGVTA